MKKIFYLFFISGIIASCSDEATKKTEPQEWEKMISIDRQEAERLLDLPLDCIEMEYPNKLNQVIGGKADLKNPKELHPAFYGCFDWHSAVHGHWSLVRLLKQYPDLKESDRIISGLKTHLSAENIEGEIQYFKDELNQGFERMYGWAWLLKLADELYGWKHPVANELYTNLKPLSDLIEKKIKEFLPKLAYPIRVGTHTNTAFALSMIHDYAKNTGNEELRTLVERRSKDYYLNDCACPMNWEPSGYDFLSPCLEEANLMRRVLAKKEFKEWLEKFLPELTENNFVLSPGIVTDRTDGHLVHLDGLNFSRVWCLYGIVETLPEYGHLTAVANQHVRYSLPSITDGNYEGGHWLASFALLALR